MSKILSSPLEKKSATSPNKKNRKLLYTKKRIKRLDQPKFVLYQRKDARNIALLSPQIAVPKSVQKNMEQNSGYKKYTNIIKRREELGAEIVWREQRKEKAPTTSGNSARLHIKANKTTYHPIKFEEEFLRKKRVDKAKKKQLLQNLTGAMNATPGQIFEPQYTLFYAAEAYTRDFLINLSPAQLIKIKQKFILYKLKTEKHDDIIINASGFINALSTTTIVKNNRLAIAGEYTNHENEDKFKKYNIILRLFDRVDINCKGNISWDEFMSYLADSADNDAILGVDSTGNNEKDMFKLFKNTVIPSVLHIKYIQPLDCIIGYGGDKFDGIGCFYSNNNSDNKKCRKVNVIGSQYGKVLSTTVAIELSYLIACFVNLTIVCYDILSLEEKATVSVLHEVTCLKYIDTKEFAFLAVGDVTGAINCFDLCTGIKIKWFKVHAEQISGLIYLKKMNSILTCSIDGYVKFRKLNHFLDDLKIKDNNNNNSNSSGNICPDGDNDASDRDGDIRSFFAHDGGVLKMVYSKKLRIIVTSGSNRTIKAWSPYSLDEVGIFVGHVEPVKNMEIICSSQRLITIDTSGILKLWNLRTFLPVQSIVTSTNSMIQKLAKRYPSMAYDCLSQHIIVANGRLIRYHLDEPTLLDKTHNNPILFSIINIELETLVTCSSNEITFWDLMTGNILNSIDVGQVFENQNETLAAICSLKAGRKIVLGGTKGTVKIICTKTCLILKKVKSHLSEVTSLVFCPMSNILLVLSRDGILRRHDTCDLHPIIEVDHNDFLCKWSNRNSNTKNNLSPIDEPQNNNVLGMAYSWNLCLIATYASDGTICLWDAVTFKIVGICDKEKHQSDIAKVIFLDPYPAFVSVGNDGIMKLFTVRPHHTPYICIMEAYNDIGPPVASVKNNKNSKNDIFTKQNKKKSVPDDYSGFTTVIWDHTKFQLVTGDLDGKENIFKYFYEFLNVIY
jgi:WD40 repeat protein